MQPQAHHLEVQLATTRISRSVETSRLKPQVSDLQHKGSLHGRSLESREKSRASLTNPVENLSITCLSMDKKPLRTVMPTGRSGRGFKASFDGFMAPLSLRLPSY